MAIHRLGSVGEEVRDALEVERMRTVANLRADAANPRWMEDVRARKLCCANGTGVVHGIAYDLAEQFAIRLAPAALPRGRKAAGGARGVARASRARGTRAAAGAP